MKAKEIIEILKKYDPNTKVVISDSEGEGYYMAIERITTGYISLYSDSLCFDPEDAIEDEDETCNGELEEVAWIKILVI